MSSTSSAIQLTANKQGIFEQLLQSSQLRAVIDFTAEQNGYRFDTLEGLIGPSSDSVVRKNATKSKILDAVSRSHCYFLVDKFMPTIETSQAYIDSDVSGKQSFTPQSRSVQVNLHIDNAASYIADQYVELETNAPKDEIKTTNPNYNVNNRYRYCAKPGIRVFKSVSLKLLQRDNETYTSDDIALWEQTHLKKDAKAAWNRCICHDEGIDAIQYNTVLEVDQVFKFKTGYQTYKKEQAGLHMFIPLHFFFNRCIGNALMIANIDKAIFTYQFELESVTNIVKGMTPGATLEDPDVIFDLPALNIKRFKIWTRHIYMGDEFVKILAGFNKFQLMRMFTQQVEQSSAVEDSVKLRNLRYAMEYIVLGVRPTSNLTSFDNWYKFCKLEERCVPMVLVDESAPGVFNHLAIEPAHLAIPSNVFKFAWFTNMGEEIDKSGEYTTWDTFKNYNVYNLSQNVLGGLTSSKEQCSGVQSWTSKPNDKCLSGFLNLSKCREVRFHWRDVDNFVSDSNPVQIVFSGHSINLFNIRDGNAAKYVLT